METFEEARDTIRAMLTSDDPDVRAKYLKHFQFETKKFSEVMAQAFMKWRLLDGELQSNDKRAYISAQVYMAIILHIHSMILFLSGYMIAAGNLSRQVIESIALALVCSGKDLGILEQFMKDNYSTNRAVRDVLHHSRTLGLKDDGVKALSDAQKFYHKYSHPTTFTIAAGMSFTERDLYVGPAFDDGKIEAYKKEVSFRVNLATIFPNFIDGVIANVAKW